MTEEQIELLIQRLVKRTDILNQKFLKHIGNSIKKLRKLTPTQALQLIQMLKYGGDYEDIVKTIAKYTNMNVKDIDAIFSTYAKKDQRFYKDFYEYRNMPFVKYAENEVLKRQTMALANISKQTMQNFTQSRALGYTINGKFYNLRETFEKVLDEAILNISQGKETFNQSMSNILEQIGGSGIRTVNYQSGRAVRLDSAVRQHLRDGLNNLHNENQKIFGKEFNADGVEISVHETPAPDHAEVQGRQFSYEEFNKFQNDKNCHDYNGKFFPAKFEGHDRRSISEYNCYHTIFPIILGVNKPAHSEKQLQEIIDRNNKGFELDGKKYTIYQGTQMQRQLETKIRKQKDIQIFARASDNEDEIIKSQNKISKLTKKYKELSQISGLPIKKNRLTVTGYQRVKTNQKIDIQKPTQISKINFDDEFNVIKNDLMQKNVIIKDVVFDIPNKELRNANVKQLQNLVEKYQPSRYTTEKLKMGYNNKHKNWIGWASFGENSVNLTENYFKDYDYYIKTQKHLREEKWHYSVPDDKLDIYTITHEYGHTIEYEYIRKQYEIAKRLGKRFNYNEADKDLRDTLITIAMNKSGEKLTISEFKNKYFSGYAKSKRNSEWFAELFAQHELGEKTPFTEALDEWLGGFYGR